MGFDIECIIDIQSYPGEYFCPVCRTLVYHTEALQAQCTHVYCKPCLAHVANGSKACPYDGYLVTESDSKPLVESDKALSEKIGKVKVHCLYFRSGCTWEGTLSESASHGSGCSFGNSPVICNRCGIQLVHRQVHDHAQICPGVHDGQQASASVSGLPKSGATSSTVTAVVNETVSQSGTPVSQPQNPQNVAATPLPGQNPTSQVNTNSHTAVVAPVAGLAPEQWYQQQYQQYYQQYGGYDPYQQPQHFYSLQQQQPFQQYPPHQVQVQGQHQSHVYSQAVVQGQPQAQHQPQAQMAQPQTPSQTQPQAQPHQHLHLQPPPPHQQPNSAPQAPPQSHLPPQAQGQVQAQLLPQGQPQVQLPQQGQAQTHPSMQAFAPNYQVNPHQPLHPVMRPQTQIPPQVLPPPPPPPPHGQPTQPPQYPQATGVRTPAQHPQVPQYQQPHVQMYYSQAHGLQPQIPPPPFTQSSNQSSVQVQQQAQPYQLQSQPPTFHPQANHQSSAPVTHLQVPHPPLPPVSGHHPYQQPLPAQKMQMGALQQYPMHPHPASGPLHPVQAHGQVPQQSALMRPPHSQGSISQQQPAALLSQSQVPGGPLAPSQQFLPHVQQPTYLTQHRPLMQPVQQGQPQNYAQQQQFLAPFQGQMPQQGPLPPQQQPMQSQVQMHPSGPPQPQQSQNYAGTPMMPNQGIHPQNQQFSSGGFAPLAPPGSAQLASTQTTVNQNYAKPPVLDQNVTDQLIRSPSKGLSEKGSEGGSLKEDIRTGQNETVLQGSDNGGNDDLVKSVIKQETGDMKGALEQPSGGKSSEAVGAEDKFRKEEVHAPTNSGPLKNVELDNQMKLSKNAVQGQSVANYDRQSLSAVPSTEGHALPAQSLGSQQERSQTQVEEKPSSVVGPQGPGAPPRHGQLNPTEGKAHGTLGGFKSFESQSGPQGPELTSLAVQRGSVGRAPARHIEGHYVSQHVRPSEVAMSRDQVSGSGDGGSHMKHHADEPNYLRANGGIALNSSVFGSRDENLKPLSRDQTSFFPMEPTRPLDQASRSLDKPFHGSIYDSGSKLDPGSLASHSRFLPHHPSGGHSHGDLFGPGPEFGKHPRKPFAQQSPGGDYLGSSPGGFGGTSSFPHVTSAMDDFNSREAHRFGEGSRSFNHSSDSGGNSFRDGRFPPLPGHLRRGDIDGPGNPRFGEHGPPALIHNQIGSDEVFGQDGPGHLMRGKFAGPGYLPGHFNMGEPEGPGSFPGIGRAGDIGGNFPRPPFSESVRGDTPGFQPFGDPALRNNYSFHGFPNAGNFSSGRDSFDQSRKRMPASTGWCKICEIDCETVERLEMHSQTREHQNMSLEIVKRIKLQNKKNQRASTGRTMHEGGSRSRKGGSSGRGTKR